MLDHTTATAIGPLLRRVRLNDGRPLAAVAAGIGISEHGVARFEHGAELTVTVFLRWCAVLDVAPAEAIRAAMQLGLAASNDRTRLRVATGDD